VASLHGDCLGWAFSVYLYDTENNADGMYRVSTHGGLRQSLIQKGLERAKLFSWEKSAREHLKVFEEVLKSSEK